MANNTLALTVSGSDHASVWATLPYLNSLRGALINSLFATPGTVGENDRGLTIMQLGQLSEAYQVCVGLRSDVGDTTAPGVSRRSISGVAAKFAPYAAFVQPAYAELVRLGLPKPHIEYLESFVNSGSPLYSLSGVATLLTLAAVLIIG